MVEVDVPVIAAPTSVVFLVGLVLGALSGYQFSRRRVRREFQDLRKRLLELENSIRDGHQRFHSESCSGSMEFECAMLNEALWHLWPYISDIAKSLLFSAVEPKLQATLPKAISGIRFSRTECHFGVTPIQIRKLIASEVKEGTWNNLTFTTELVLNGDSHIELGLPEAGQRYFGTCTALPTTVGISHVKFRGTLVIELTNLVPKVPLVSGVRVYFINPPLLDLTMTGGLSGLLNVSLVKQKIIEAVLNSLGKHFVLPKRVAQRFAKGTDIFKLKAPQPEGMLRLEIADFAGEALQSALSKGKLFLRVILGDRDWQTVLRVSTGQGNAKASERGVHKHTLSVVECSTELGASIQGGQVVDLEVHNRTVQQLCIQVYGEETSRLWGGSRRGQLLAQCLVSCHDLVEEREAWWPLVACDLRPGMGLLETRFSVAAHPIPGVTGPQVQLRSEWRPFSTAKPKHFPTSRGLSIPHDWQLRKDVNLGVTSMLLVGVSSASHLPVELARYWCSVQCPSAVTQRQAKKGEDTKSTQRSKGKVVGETHAHGPFVEALWDRALFYHLEDPREATVTFSVFQGNSSGRGKHRENLCLGSTVYRVERLLFREGMREVFRAPLDHSVQNLVDLAEEASGKVRPRVQVEVTLQLWVLGPPEQADREEDEEEEEEESV